MTLSRKGAAPAARARGVACFRNDGMERRRDARALRPQFRDRGIVEEGNIVIDGEDDGLVEAEARIFPRRLEDRDERGAFFALGRMGEDALHQNGEFGAGVMDQVFGRGIACEGGEETGERRIAGADEARGFRQMRGGFRGLVMGFLGRRARNGLQGARPLRNHRELPLLPRD